MSKKQPKIGKGINKKSRRGSEAALCAALVEAWAPFPELCSDPEVGGIPLDLVKGLDSKNGARDAWDSLTVKSQRDWVLWITTANKPDTRARRVSLTVEKLAKGDRRPCCFSGLPWMAKMLKSKGSKK